MVPIAATLMILYIITVKKGLLIPVIWFYDRGDCCIIFTHKSPFTANVSVNNASDRALVEISGVTPKIVCNPIVFNVSWSLELSQSWLWVDADVWCKRVLTFLQCKVLRFNTLLKINVELKCKYSLLQIFILKVWLHVLSPSLRLSASVKVLTLC